MNKSSKNSFSTYNDIREYIEQENKATEIPTEYFSEFYNYYYDPENPTIYGIDISKLIWRLIQLEIELKDALKEKAEAIFKKKHNADK